MHNNKRSRFFPSGPSSCRPNLSQSNDTHKAHRFHREDLQNAEVIAQVDRKFVVCCINERGSEGGADATGDEEREVGRTRGVRGRALVLIDQHAASERVRVERFLRRICVAFLTGLKVDKGKVEEGDVTEENGEEEDVMKLEPPRPVLLTKREVDILRERADVRALLGRWGIGLVLDGEGLADVEKDRDAAYSQVWVQSVPEVVAKKVGYMSYPPLG